MRNDNTKNILVCPLYWGAGHAARVQLIGACLRKKGHRVIIAAPGILHKTFGDESYDELIHLGSPGVLYSRYLPQYLAILLQFPLFLIALLADRLRLPGIIREHDVDLVISDNRFGLWSRRTPCVYITHQLSIPLPEFLSFAGPFVSSIHRYIAGRYDECWIPDLPGDKNLSGKLSHE